MVGGHSAFVDALFPVTFNSRSTSSPPRITSSPSFPPSHFILSVVSPQLANSHPHTSHPSMNRPYPFPKCQEKRLVSRVPISCGHVAPQHRRREGPRDLFQSLQDIGAFSRYALCTYLHQRFCGGTFGDFDNRLKCRFHLVGCSWVRLARWRWRRRLSS
ncbi:hypothetical protein K443DRAFT_465690 [Laccaria amethystina LaAM-08-1]|uniref:Uncharacterized protein n=1 Tax=Laccaria amethystina LaAM-08-1 TaxID=1095629 RepID=A0A0C9WVW1_9AGAR|nr:hypothetical protein K443DRAFT_465690 [Laccaria amethystina LaAM-08-1]